MAYGVPSHHGVHVCWCQGVHVKGKLLGKIKNTNRDGHQQCSEVLLCQHAQSSRLRKHSGQVTQSNAGCSNNVACASCLICPAMCGSMPDDVPAAWMCDARCRHHDRGIRHQVVAVGELGRPPQREAFNEARARSMLLCSALITTSFDLLRSWHGGYIAVVPRACWYVR